MGNCCTSEPKIQSVWFGEFERQLPSLSGKRVAITGTTSGTGFVAALTCMKKGAEVFVLNRESSRSKAALQQLQKECPGASVQQIACDLMDFASVREAARLLNTACQGRLDVLCNNAGIMATPDLATKDGYDQQMQTNHLSHFLLTKELLPALRAAAKENGEARIVNHSSEARKGSPLDAEFVRKNGGNLSKKGGAFERYHQTKLANILFTYELADQLAGENIKAVAATPGIAATNLMVNNPCMMRMVSCCVCCFAQSAEDGTMGILTGMAGPDVVSGDLYVPSIRELKGPVQLHQRPKVSKVTQDKDSQKLLWEESEKAVSAEFKI